MAESFSVTINAVIFRDGEDWIVQGIEHDICAQGPTVSEARRAFEQSVIGTALFGAAKGSAPLSDIPPAPEEYRAMFERADVSINSTNDDANTDSPLLQRNTSPKVKPILRLFERPKEALAAFAY